MSAQQTMVPKAAAQAGVLYGFDPSNPNVLNALRVSATGQLVTAVQGGGSPITVNANTRTCVGRQTISVTAGAVVSLTVPAGAVSAMIQADGSTVSMTLDASTPSATVGTRIDDGVILHIDSVLASVRLIARTVTTNVQVAYFDRA
jgi:hypothetical protein